MSVAAREGFHLVAKSCGRLVAAIRDFGRRVVWPEAPRPVAFELRDHDLVQAWMRMLFYAGAGAPGTSLDDMLWQARAEDALCRLLADFYAGRAQTPIEQLLAQSLDYIAHTYGGRRK